MILYTPLSYEDIHLTEADYQQYELVTYQMRPCYAERLENGDLRLIQLLSTDPSDYLHEQFQPGKIISTS